MTDRQLVALPCKLSAGMFSSERVFAVTMANGQVYHGIAPRHFCWNKQGHPLAEHEAAQEVDGKVAAKVVEELEAGQVAVEVPDGEVIAVPKGHVLRRPTEIRPPTIPAPVEPKPNVPV